MTDIESITLDVADPVAAARFHADAFDLGEDRLKVRAAAEPSEGFRGFTLALTVPRPADVDSFVASAVAAGAAVLKPAAKSLWGYGAVVQAPDGAIWKLATSAKKDTGPATRRIEEFVLLIGVADFAATKRYYVDRGFAVAKGFGRVYAEFAAGTGAVKLALYRRRALAKDLGVAPEGGGSHRLTVNGGGPEAFTDPDGFRWAPAGAREAGVRETGAREAEGRAAA
ncbi:glyoxalase [Kitasatospora sp. NRRL B-11411]|uniref:glyoxalase n=1 Tax=Kitasatospora sp. NRRL B-11411 TaxID=1463822 RepID=UPI00068B0D73|nr:glyoxalase [Kitasatospora sp. NRRL B-11411]